MIVATPAMAWLGLGPLWPAAAKHSGTTTAMPSPISAEPADGHRRMPRDDDQQPAERGQHAARPHGAHRAEPVTTASPRSGPPPS